MDASGKKLMWRGIARSATPDSPKPEQITKIVDQSVTKLLAKFPAKR